MDQMTELIEIFREESYEIIDNLADTLLDWEDDPKSYDYLPKIMRLLHTLKGSSAMYEFNQISQFTHKLETIYKFLDDKKLNISSDLIDSSLKATDYLKKLVDEDDYKNEVISDNGKAILTKMKKIILISH